MCFGKCCDKKNDFRVMFVENVSLLVTDRYLKSTERDFLINLKNAFINLERVSFAERQISSEDVITYYYTFFLLSHLPLI